VSDVGEAVELNLDPALLDRLADIVCGENRAFYRRGWEIAALFERAGWTWAGDEVEPSRGGWTRELLQDPRATPRAMSDLVLRLANPVEYVENAEGHLEALDDLRELLSYQQLTIQVAGGQPVIVSLDQAGAHDSIGGDQVLELDATLASIVNDERFGAQLEQRLNEARVCWENEAFLAATIMLGSLLEGVLYDRAISTGTSPGDRPSLASLINLAVAEDWINYDIAQYAHILREHRNLVHPRQQHEAGNMPDTGSVHIAWNVAVATLNSISAAN